VQDYSGYEHMLVEREDGLLTVTLNRPKSLNAVSYRFHLEIEDLFARVAVDPSVTTVLITGAGRAFCAGADMKELDEETGGDDPIARTERWQAATRRLAWNMLDIEQPIVTAVQGYALGFGSTLALFSDVVVAAEDAIFADNHVTAGLVAGDGGTVIWPMVLPFGIAKYYLLTGERIDGAEAARLGMIYRAVPADKLLDEARAVAIRLAKGAPIAVRGTKRAMNKLLRERLELCLDMALTLEGQSTLTADHQEAARAFVEKREPVFRGR